MTPAQRAGKREWWGLAVLVLVTLIISMDMTVLSYALPRISETLQPSSSQLLWITDIYAFVLAGLLIPMGTLGDRIGRRKLLIIGAAAFGIASAVSAYAGSAEMLIASRALMGAAGATLMPSTMSLIRTMFQDEQQRRAAIGLWSAGFSAGGAIGLLLGGVLLQTFNWGVVFLINVPIMLVLVVASPLLLPEYRNPQAGRFDIVSSILLFASVLPAVWGIKEFAEQGFGWQPLAAVVVGLLFLPLFIVRQRGLDDPMVDVRLFGKAAFSAALFTNVLANFALVGFMFFTAQYLQLVLGLDPFVAGLWSLPQAFTAAIGAAVLAPVLTPKLRHGGAIAVGLVIGTCGFLLMSQVGVENGLFQVVAGQMLATMGMAMALTLTAELVVTTAPQERAGAAAGLSETGSQFGSALGVAVLGSVGAFVYRSQLTDTPPAGVPAAALDTARETLGAAIEAAKGLSEGAGNALRLAAKTAFTDELHVAAYTVSGVLLLTAVVAVALLRRVPRPTPPPQGAPDEAADAADPDPVRSEENSGQQKAGSTA
ncbi:MFS transporter [Saccharothrix syringae]|uniref:MFS transporter n=1 Tax=Saccharothrix syringae TaxID=103733 RepID=A0A5Q0H6Q9_SACSY|nr:MFS transporter [Saccharothrix syringae]QFZ21585.1 MFS transporter [Saccharothrix syringae]